MPKKQQSMCTNCSSQCHLQLEHSRKPVRRICFPAKNSPRDLSWVIRSMFNWGGRKGERGKEGEREGGREGERGMPREGGECVYRASCARGEHGIGCVFSVKRDH